MVSVVIPNYNRSKLIYRAVESVLKQSYNDLEVIVVDDKSTDDSVERLKEIEDPRLRVIVQEKNGGACIARNTGIEQATGHYIAFLDSDDVWQSNKIEKQLDYLNKTKLKGCFSAYEYVSQKGNREIRPKENPDLDNLYQNLLIKNAVTTGTILVEKEVLKEIRFDTVLPRYQDWDFALQICKKFDIGFMKEPLLVMYEQKNSITNTTSYEKKLFALKYLMEKYKKEIDACRQSKARFLWSIAMYSLCVNSDDYIPVKIALESDKSNKKKKMVFFACKIGLTNFIAKLYRRNH